MNFVSSILSLWEPVRLAVAGFLEGGEIKREELLFLPVSCGAARTAEPGTATNLFKTICFYHLSLLIHKHAILLGISIKNLSL